MAGNMGSYNTRDEDKTRECPERILLPKLVTKIPQGSMESRTASTRWKEAYMGNYDAEVYVEKDR